ncbi:TraR/DksA C4-type zinc finger protein [Fodinisporobacter ferrooxydans]|uniref:TraR/DksA C4-type zinc finger protein n=1 Tax=Fodinisporobacter ferrooxydans TaxID=2901836 RepID=A0ABY4CIC7_9BACL|nr:TraR/DksA C4-type zinc finger protein [Alicyclobacillaceae bacterium MYW30-H2]
MLTTEQLQVLRERLLQERDERNRKLENTDAYGLATQMRDSLGELSMYDNHPADIGDELFERGKDLALREADSLSLERIDQALGRMEDGTYGICEQCGEPISFARLQAEPAAARCIDCQEILESNTVENNRPVEENFLFPGYGRTNLDTQDQTGFDGEDSWQAVDRFNQIPNYENNYNDIEYDDNEGIVEDTDRITNQMYIDQLPDKPQYTLLVDEYTLPEEDTER